MYSINELSNKCHVSIRTIETNIALFKGELTSSGKITIEGNKWLISRQGIKTVTNRKYAKHYVNYDNSIKADDIDLLALLKEKEYKTFITIAPKGIKSLQKMKDIARDIFELYHNNYPATIPTYFVYGIEINTDYLNEKQNKGYHIHAVTNAEFSHLQKKEIYEMLIEQLGADKVHENHTVQVNPYVMGIGVGALKYTIKSNQNTGCYIK